MVKGVNTWKELRICQAHGKCLINVGCCENLVLYSSFWDKRNYTALLLSSKIFNGRRRVAHTYFLCQQHMLQEAMKQGDVDY